MEHPSKVGALFNQVSATKLRLETGKTVTGFAGAGYLGLAFNPEVLEALSNTSNRFGLGLGASVNTIGRSPEMVRLEGGLAEHAGAEEAVVLANCTVANVAVLEMLGPQVDAWFVDEHSHASFRKFAMRGYSGIEYKHLDAQDLLRKIESVKPGSLGVFTDAIFPAAGDLAPLTEIGEAVRGQNSILVVDEAHSFGVLGQRGQGATADAGLLRNRVIITGTCGKALGCVGGFIAGDRELVGKIRKESAFYAGSGALPPALCEAASVALDIVRRDSDLLARLRGNCRYITAALARVPGFKGSEVVPIFCLTGPEEAQIRRAQALCLAAGIYVPVLTGYPAAGSQACLRWIVTSEHESSERDRLCGILLKEFGPSAD